MRYIYFYLITIFLANPSFADNRSFEDKFKSLQSDWAIARFDTDKQSKLEAFLKLRTIAIELVSKHPKRAESLIWLAVIKNNIAGINADASSLEIVSESRRLLERAKKIDPKALNGYAYIALGGLYYSLPGWPWSFGDNEKAASNLLAALEISPNGVDANYFYADYLINTNRSNEAKQYLIKALNAAPQKNRPIADEGRRQQARMALNKLQ